MNSVGQISTYSLTESQKGHEHIIKNFKDWRETKNVCQGERSVFWVQIGRNSCTGQTVKYERWKKWDMEGCNHRGRETKQERKL